MPPTPKVFDIRPGNHSSFDTLPKLGLDDLDTLQEFYHFTIDYEHGYGRALPGQLYWGIMAFELKAGPAILQPQVRDEEGKLLDYIEHPGILLFLHWPGSDPFPTPPDPLYHTNGVPGWTESKGTVGWGFGGESHIGEDGGPYTVWCSADPAGWADRRVGSDAVKKLGWWDDHIIPNPIFQIMRKPGAPPPPPGDAEYLVNIDKDGNITGNIAWRPGPPQPGAAAIGLSRGGIIRGHVPWTPGGASG